MVFHFTFPDIKMKPRNMQSSQSKKVNNKVKKTVRFADDEESDVSLDSLDSSDKGGSSSFDDDSDSCDTLDI